MSPSIIEHTSEMSRNVSINLYLRPCSIAVYRKFHLYCLYHLRFFWSVNYVLHFASVKVHKHCLYWNVCSTDINGKLFSTVCYFLSHFCWSVNYVSWVSKVHNFLLTCSETEARCIFKGFQYCHLWKVQFQLSSTCFSFFSSGM